MDKEKLEALGIELVQYCAKYFIPIESVFEILNDQKVTPMTRGKAMEFNAYLLLKKKLNRSEWSIEKLNLCAQPGTPDEDITITHKRTGIKLKVESKTAVRESFSAGNSRTKYKAPHFKVKCHRSRSHLKKSKTGNDRYTDDSFDIILTNPSNAFLKGKTITSDLEFITDSKKLNILFEKYDVLTNEELLKASYADWRFVYPREISESGFIPRTPYVLLSDDPKWLSVERLEEKMMEIVEIKRGSSRR